MDAEQTLLLGIFQRQDGQPCHAKAQSGQFLENPLYTWMHNAYIKKKCDMIMIMWGLSCPVHDSAQWNVDVDSNMNTNPIIHCTRLQTTCSCVTLQAFWLWFPLTRSPDCWAGPCWAAMKRTSQCTGPGWSRWSGLDSLIQPRSPEACGTDTLRVDERESESFQFIWPWRRRTQTSSRAEKHWNVTRKRSSLSLSPVGA